MITLNCLKCGKEFKVIKCREKTAIYCSKECMYSSEEHGLKMSKSKKGKSIATKGGQHWWKCAKSFVKGHTPWNKGKEYLAHKGEGNPMWAGGISFGKYGFDFTTRLKETIRERDNYRCQECSKHQDELYDSNGTKYKLMVHHIDYDKNNNDKNNLISLCRNCHLHTNRGRDSWTSYFKTKQYGEQI